MEVSEVTQLQHTNRIVVGLDGAGAHDDVVLAAALAEARLTQATVSVVHAITPGDVLPTAPVDETERRQRSAARHTRIQSAVEALRRHVARLPDQQGARPAVHYNVEHGDPATVLLGAARYADLIVIGSRSEGSGSPFLLGTVSQDVSVHAACPVLLVPRAGAMTSTRTREPLATGSARQGSAVAADDTPPQAWVG
jgi:nucleotide-binding universal stress UspA family protein